MSWFAPRTNVLFAKRRAWLCGYDPVTKKNYYRKQWIYERLAHGSAGASPSQFLAARANAECLT